MKKTLVLLIACLAAGVVLAASFTDVNSSQYHGRTKIPKLTEALDANFAAIEAGTVTVGASLAITTNAYTLTPTAAVMLCTPSVVSTTTLANASSAGQTLTVVNVGTNNLIIADSANVQSTGAITLGQWDSLSFVGEMSATNWVMTGTSNN